MIASARRLLKSTRRAISRVRDVETILINQGRILSAGYAGHRLDRLSDAEFQVFSQWGEDGIIQYLIANLAIEARTFVEFGVETFTEANCRFLMMKDHWSGLVIDGSRDNIEAIRSSKIYWKYHLQAVESFITRDNIGRLIDSAGFDGIGLLSVDVDGVDWYILEALRDRNPAIVAVEYNGLFGSGATVTVPYREDFVRSRAHHSNIYYGASLSAFDWLLRQWGYSLVGGNAAGNNAFFVRDDLLNDRVRAVPVTEVYRPTVFSETRDERGDLTFIRGAARRQLVAHLPLVDVTTGAELTVADLPVEDVG